MLVNKGALSCASRINQVTNFLKNGAKDVATFLFFPTGNIDTKMVSASMEVIDQ